jgi:hypothetical protein
LGVPEVREVGEELDRKLAQLLEALEVPVPRSLVAGVPTTNPASPSDTVRHEHPAR